MIRTNNNTSYPYSVLVSLVLTVSASAQAYEVRAGFPTVPGAAELENGQVTEAIEKLEAQVDSAQGDRKASVLTTLCGAYIVAGDFGSATATCEEAVKHNQRTAYNNRGVLRALQGDLDGAKQDFVAASRISYGHFERITLRNRIETAARNAEKVGVRLAARKQRGDTSVATSDD